MIKCVLIIVGLVVLAYITGDMETFMGVLGFLVLIIRGRLNKYDQRQYRTRHRSRWDK